MLAHPDTTFIDKSSFASYCWNFNDYFIFTGMWKCSVRRRGNVCPAGVVEEDGRFTRNGKSHTHTVNPNSKIRSLLNKNCGEEGITQPFKKSGTIVNEVMNNVLKKRRRYPDIQKVLVFILKFTF